MASESKFKYLECSKFVDILGLQQDRYRKPFPVLLMYTEGERTLLFYHSNIIAWLPVMVFCAYT